MRRAAVATVLALILAAVAALPPTAAAEPTISTVRVPGLDRSVRVRTDADGVPHIFAVTDRDALFMLGYLHARDRFFQMDLLRRQFDGTLAELLGDGALASDIQLRTLGLRRAAEASLPTLSETTQLWLAAYADGVNAYLATNPLPPEYGALELTSARPWEPADSVTIGKGLAFGLSFDLSDIAYTEALLSFQGVGAVAGFDGTALFSEDTYRSAPFDPTTSLPTDAPAPGRRTNALPAYLQRAAALATAYKRRAEAVPMLARALQPQRDRQGSNWWVVSGDKTVSGAPILANDPHLSLSSPSVFYEAGIRIDPRAGRAAMNAFGVTFPGVPGVVLGCNPWICWGATTNPMDVTDVYLEELALDPQSGLPVGTRFEDTVEPLQVIPQTFRVNQIGDQQPDDLVVAPVGPMDGGVTLVVPRRNHGPIVQVSTTSSTTGTLHGAGLSVQYTGWGATRELDAFQMWNRARNLDDFRDGLQYFDVGSQNWAYADVAGNIAYFTSAEMPLREDLQLLQAPAGGVPPWLIRDGTHQLAHEWLADDDPGPGQSLPYQILPAAEMPHVVNPPAGFVLSANNDPVGTTIDNNPLNQLRPGGGLFYLNQGYAGGFRAGRIRRLIEDALSGGGKLTREQIASFQSNNQLLDAEVLVPYLVQAYSNASAADALPALAAFRSDPEVDEAVTRLALWDHSTPTGITQGFDPGDPPTALPAPSVGEIADSVAATIYSVWRGQVVQRVIDGTLARVGLDSFPPGSSVAMAALRHHLDTFPRNQGVGASGLPFFVHQGARDPADARDLILLESLRSALDLLASDTFAPAFDHSTNQDDYRWGKLHRIVFDHPLGGPFSLPSGGGFSPVGPDLPGVAKAGGFGSVDAASHSARADDLNEFMFGSGPARRFVGEMSSSGPIPMEVIPGGESGVPGSPFFGSQLGLWLTDHYHPYPYRPDDVVDASVLYEVFAPQNGGN